MPVEPGDVVEVFTVQGQPDGALMVMFECPGCKGNHGLTIGHKNSSGAQWQFNGDKKKPTLSPSVLQRLGPMPTVPEGREDAGKIHVCHLFLHDGVAQFLSDCTHEMAGKSVALPPIVTET